MNQVVVFKNLLSQRKASILKRWFQLILGTYSADSSSFFEQEKNRFINPVGYALSQGIEVLYEELLNGMNSDKLYISLDNIVRVRAVQDFSPSQAIAFIFLLKKAIRDNLEKEIRENSLFEELLKLESRVDKLALLAFDIYMRCRENIYEIRVNKVKAEIEGTLKLLGKKSEWVKETRQ